MGSAQAETAYFLVTVWLAGGIVVGLLGYLSTLFGFATLMRVPLLARIPALSLLEARAAAGEGQGASLRRQNAGLLLLSLGLALILTACALEGYVYALLIHVAAG